MDMSSGIISNQETSGGGREREKCLEWPNLWFSYRKSTQIDITFFFF